MQTRSIMAITAGLLIALPVGPALAKDDRAEVRTGGLCTAGANWKLKVKQDDAGVEVEFEVDSNVVGQAWDYTLSGPGGVISSGQRTTTAPSGSFSVEVMTAGAVTDTFKGAATFNGQTCDTTVSAPVQSPNPTPSPTDDNPGSDDSSDDKGGRGRGTDDNPGSDDNPGRGSDDRIIGDCSDDSAAAVLRVKGRKATLRVDSDSRGEAWEYEIRRDGKVVKKGTARTKGSKAVFKVKAKSRGAGAFTATAAKVGSDDTCEISS